MTKQIFLSSTFQDLKDERSAVEAGINRINMHFIGMEHFGSFPGEPVLECTKRVAMADLLILVLAGRYGFIPPGHDQSVTHIEYETAKINSIPILAYVKGAEIFDAQDGSPMLQKLKNEVRLSHGITEFSSPSDLAWKVVADVARFFQDASQAKDLDAVNRVVAADVYDRSSELIDILEHRAQKILGILLDAQIAPHRRFAARVMRQIINLLPIPFIGKSKRPYGYVNRARYAKKFQQLHARHIIALRGKNFVHAHELLGEIHDLLYRLEQDQFWKRHARETPGFSYSLRSDAFQRGAAICEYVAGDFSNYSEKYPSGTGLWAHSMNSPFASYPLWIEMLKQDD